MLCDQKAMSLGPGLVEETRLTTSHRSPRSLVTVIRAHENKLTIT